MLNVDGMKVRRGRRKSDFRMQSIGVIKALIREDPSRSCRGRSLNR